MDDGRTAGENNGPDRRRSMCQVPGAGAAFFGAPKKTAPFCYHKILCCKAPTKDKNMRGNASMSDAPATPSRSRGLAIQARCARLLGRTVQHELNEYHTVGCKINAISTRRDTGGEETESAWEAAATQDTDTRDSLSFRADGSSSPASCCFCSDGFTFAVEFFKMPLG